MKGYKLDATRGEEMIGTSGSGPSMRPLLASVCDRIDKCGR